MLPTARDDPDARRRANGRAALLTPVAKAFATDLGNEVASLGVQVHGGMGFVEETGAAQLMRDVRIAAIYEERTVSRRSISYAANCRSTGVRSLPPNSTPCGLSLPR